MPKIDIENLTTNPPWGYPEPFRQAVMGRIHKRLGDAVGLDQFGVNFMRLKPGAASAQLPLACLSGRACLRPAGELVLCEEGGETVLRAGDAAGFKAGIANGHCLLNRSGEDAVFLEIGASSIPERVEYPDIDLRLEWDERGMHFLHRSGEPW